MINPTTASTVRKLKDIFGKVFAPCEDLSFYFAPGRVNLIGEHTDYNGGHVFPCALTLGTYAAAAPNDLGIFRLYSENFASDGIRELDYVRPAYDKANGWCNYPMGVVWALEQLGFMPIGGLDIVFFGDLPNGAGLSSSASIEVLMGTVLSDVFGWHLSPIEIAKQAQIAENKFIGLYCGIMDQFAVAAGRECEAILLDTNTLNYEYVPLSLGDVKIVIANTNKKRGLADSKYNERRSECEAALADIQKSMPIRSLGELTAQTWTDAERLIADETCKKRARHAVFENLRTLDALNALNHNDLVRFGQLMNESHRSLRDDYEVTGKELDTLVAAAQAQPGVLGARMTGAGFGGCTVNLVAGAYIDAFVEAVCRIYREKIGYGATCYVVSAGDGARKLA